MRLFVAIVVQSSSVAGRVASSAPEYSLANPEDEVLRLREVDAPDRQLDVQRGVKVGDGHFGKVFKSMLLSNRRPVAMKELANSGASAANEAALMRYVASVLFVRL